MTSASSNISSMSSGTGAYENLVSQGLDPAVATLLDGLIAEGYYPPEGYAQEVVSVFFGLSPEQVTQIVTTYKTSDFSNVTNFGQLLVDTVNSCLGTTGYGAAAVKYEPESFAADTGYASMSSYRGMGHQPMRGAPRGGGYMGGAGFGGGAGFAGPKPAASLAPTSQRMQDILDRTQYKYEVTSGQRSYGPGPGYENFKPAKGCQCYFGKIPMDYLVEDLVELFEKSGTIYHMRLMMNPETGKNQTFGFVTFTDPEEAKNCVNMYNGYDCVLPGTNRRRKMVVNISEPNRRLFVGPVPKAKSKEDIWSAFSAIVEGIEDVIIHEPAEPSPTAKNKGFCFLDFTDHKLAATAKKKLQSGSIPIQAWRNFTGYGCDWADPQDEPDEEVMAKVKNLYITKLTDSVTEDDIRDRFQQYGPVDRVKKVNNYAFVHYLEREHAMAALENENGKPMKDAVMRVALAKPVSAESKQKMQMLKEKRNFGGFGGGPRGGGMGMGGAPPMGGGYGDYGYAEDYGYDQYAYGGGYGGGYGGYSAGYAAAADPYAADPYAAGAGGYAFDDTGFGARGRGGMRGRGAPSPMRGAMGFPRGGIGVKRPYGTPTRGAPPAKRGRGF